MFAVNLVGYYCEAVSAVGPPENLLVVVPSLSGLAAI
jgi:hypothetical protein